MIEGLIKKIYINLDERADAIVAGIDDRSNEAQDFTEGDTYNVRIFLRHGYSNNGESSKAYQIPEDQKLVIALATRANLTGNEDFNYISYIDTFEEVLDEENGQVAYDGVLSLNTQEAINAFDGDQEVNIYLEAVIEDKLFGRQISTRGQVNLHKSIIRGGLGESFSPSINIGNYSTVVSLANGIVDSRILDLKAGAPLEFDTLYELAHYAQKVRSHEIVMGDFYAYLDGKKLADQNLSVVSLGNLAIDTSTYTVSHEPWRPRNLIAEVVE